MGTVPGCARLRVALAEVGLAAGPLIGTHAHEIMSVFGQLLASQDAEAGARQQTGPLPLSALLAHLAFLRANGGLGAATALCDTFGSAAFVSAACAAAVPAQFRQDMREAYPDEPPVPEGARQPTSYCPSQAVPQLQHPPLRCAGPAGPGAGRYTGAGGQQRMRCRAQRP